MLDRIIVDSTGSTWYINTTGVLAVRDGGRWGGGIVIHCGKDEIKIEGVSMEQVIAFLSGEGGDILQGDGRVIDDGTS